MFLPPPPGPPPGFMLPPPAGPPPGMFGSHIPMYSFHSPQGNVENAILEGSCFRTYDSKPYSTKIDGGSDKGAQTND